MAAKITNKKVLLLLLAGAGLMLLAVVGLLLLKQFGLKNLIAIIGYPGLIAIIYAESGLFFGFFLPGDSLLVTAGLLASQNYFNFILLLLVLPLAAVLGDSTGYWFGHKVGTKIFKEEGSFLFDKRHLDRAHAFYEKHGGKTIILARFIPVIRTFAPIVAGAANMEYIRFVQFNIIGGVSWSMGMLVLGYFLGNVIPDVDKYLLPIIGLIIFLSLLPPMIEYYREHKGHIFSEFMDTINNLFGRN
jgi:membrane-associated protein